METDRWGGEAFDALYRDSAPAILTSVRWIVGDTEVAREITQDAFVAALVRWKKISGYDNPGAWVRRVAIRDAVRATRRLRRPEMLLAEAPVHDPDDVVMVRTAVSALPARQRAAVVSHYFFDRPVSEVAAALGCSEGTAKTHLHRARATLARVLNEQDDE